MVGIGGRRVNDAIVEIVRRRCGAPGEEPMRVRGYSLADTPS
jgi:hypothetical protein